LYCRICFSRLTINRLNSEIMKKNTSTYIIFLFTAICFTTNTLAQVGINTTDPKGILDINSTNTGVVYPNVALIAADNSSPVVNPQGGAIVAGTVVYNTNTTFNGTTTDVYPGIYVWDGSKWIIHYKKRQSELHDQTAVLRTESNFAGNWQDIPGLGISDTKVFTAKYSGLYRVEVKTNFGGGRTQTNNSIFVGLASGQFRFLFDGSPNYFETNAYSAYSSFIGSGTYFDAIWKESYDTYYINLVAGTAYPFSLCFDAYDAPGFIGNGSSTNPTLVDLVNEDFQGYSVTQNHTSDPQCSTTDGWERTNSTTYRCTPCTDDHLLIYSNNNSCTQNATALVNFTPTTTSVNINFDYEFRERNNKNDSFRVYLHDGTSQVGGDLLYIDNSGTVTTDTYYYGTSTVVAGTTHTLRFEYINLLKAYGVTLDNLVISEFSGSTSGDGRGYIGNEVDCQVEFTYIGE